MKKIIIAIVVSLGMVVPVYSVDLNAEYLLCSTETTPNIEPCASDPGHSANGDWYKLDTMNKHESLELKNSAGEVLGILSYDNSTNTFTAELEEDITLMLRFSINHNATYEYYEVSGPGTFTKTLGSNGGWLVDFTIIEPDPDDPDDPGCTENCEPDEDEDIIYIVPKMPNAGIWVGN